MLGQNKKEKQKVGLIQNNYIQLFPLLIFFFYKEQTATVKSSQRLKTAPLTEDSSSTLHPIYFSSNRFSNDTLTFFDKI